VREAKHIYNQNRRELVANKIRFRKYDITQQQFDEMLQQQNGQCAICQKPMDKIHIDHNHVTGLVRQLLCNNCNLGLGFFKDDTGILRSAIDYIERN